MKLEEKGKIIAPPVLNKYPQQVSEEIQKWDDIISATHWNLYDRKAVDGADFYVGEIELGHIHLDGSIHLATNAELRDALLKNKLAVKFPYGQNWVMFNIINEADVEQAILLFKLNYERIKGIDSPSLMESIETFIKK
jgi:hypothetical protein